MTDIIVFDSEILPSHYLFKAKRLSDQKVVTLWGGVDSSMERLGALLRNPGLLWVASTRTRSTSRWPSRQLAVERSQS